MKEDERPIPYESALYVVKKFQKVGFEGLKDEDLAIAIAVPEFKDTFLKQTGVDWGRRYEVKALERLRKVHFDIQWMTSKRREEFVPLFGFVKKGDLAKTKDFLRACGDIEEARTAVDEQCRSPLHVAAKEGHSTLVEYLLLQGFSVFARDKQLKTPLHDAAYNGQEFICEQLIKKGALIDASDSKGRTAFHYACCGSSANIVVLLLGVCPEVIEAEDMGQLRGLHYAILNSSLKQIEIVRALLEFQADVNCRDKEGKTPLFYAAEAGRTRIIPLLMQKGADMTLANYENYKTPLDVAANEHTRELLIVYGTPTAAAPVKKEDIQWMNAAVKGQGLGSVKEVPFEGGTKGMKKEKRGTTKLKEEEGTIQGWVRERFFSMLKKVQEEGVKANQHLKKPFIYTGSWMESISTVDELYEFLQSINGAESCLCSFNILCPFDKPLPSDEEKQVIDNFFGDAWQVSIKKPMEDRLKKELEIQEKLQKLEDIEVKLDYKDKILKDKIEELKKLRQENADLKVKVQENEGVVQKGGKIMGTAEIEELQQQITTLKAELKEKSRQLVEKDMELELAKLEGGSESRNAAGTLVDPNPMKELIQLREEMRQHKMEGKMQRFKSGQIFLKALQEGKRTKGGKKEVDAQSVENLQDDEAIINMYMALRNNPPNFIQRLKDVDKDGDNKLTQQEFVKYCSNLGISNQDIVGLQRIAGFFDGKQLLGIAEFKNILENRPKQRQIWEERLFRKVIEAIQSRKLTLEGFFELIDTDKSGEVTPQELREGFENLKIVLNQKDFNSLFCIFDKDKNNSISLSEMKAALENYFEPSGQPNGENDEQQNQEDQDDAEGKYSPDNNALCKEENHLFLIEEPEVDNDVDIVNGQLKLQLPTLRGVENKLRNIFLRICLPGSVENTILHSTQIYNSFIKVAQKFRFKDSTSAQLGRYIQVQIFSDGNYSEDSYIGEIHFAWKACLNDPNNWHCNQEFSLLNLSFPSKKVQGFLAVQARFIPSPIQGTKIEGGQNVKNNESVQEIDDNDNKAQGSAQDKEYLEQQRKYMQLQKDYMKQQQEFMKLQNQISAQGQQQQQRGGQISTNSKINNANTTSNRNIGKNNYVSNNNNNNYDYEEDVNFNDMSSNIQQILSSQDYYGNKTALEEMDSDVDFLKASRMKLTSNQSNINLNFDESRIDRSIINQIDDNYDADLQPKKRGNPTAARQGKQNQSQVENNQIYSMNSDIDQLLNTSDMANNPKDQKELASMSSNINFSGMDDL